MQVTKRFFLEQLIFNRGYASIEDFNYAFSVWRVRNGNSDVNPSFVRQYISGKTISSEKLLSLAEFLDAFQWVKQIDALYRPPQVKAVGEYWVEINPPRSRPPFRVKDIDLSAAIEVTDGKITKK